MNATPVDLFFADYPGFNYDESASVVSEFWRMCDHFKWKKAKKTSIHAEFKDALTKQFNALYGIDVDDIEAWRHLCQVLDITPIPSKLRECRNAVKLVHVNLVDLVDTVKTGEPVTIFDTEFDLSTYTKDTGKFFPMENAFAGGVLKFLLRHIFNPSRGFQVSGRRGKGRGRSN